MAHYIITDQPLGSTDRSTKAFLSSLNTVSTHLDANIHALLGDPQPLLQALHHPLAVVRLLAVASLRLAAPEQVRTRGHSPALIRFFEELAGRQRALRPQRLRVLLRKAADLLQSAHDQSNGGQLGLRVGYLVLVQREGLGHELVRNGLVVLKFYLIDGERPLQEQTERELGKFGLDERHYGLMAILEYFLAFLVPFVVVRVLVAERQLVGLENEGREGVFDLLGSASCKNLKIDTMNMRIPK